MIVDTGIKPTTSGLIMWTEPSVTSYYNEHAASVAENLNEITFDKHRYLEHVNMITWCLDYLGSGGWTLGRPKTWVGMGNKTWAVSSAFGNITFSFKDPKHLTLFILKWGAE